MKLKTLLLVLLSLAAFSVSAQKFNPNPTFLKGESQINLVFDYSQVKFDGVSQENFYKKKDARWIRDWEGQRRDNNEKAFKIYSTKWLNRIDLDLDRHPNAKYTMIVNVDDCNFGGLAGPPTPRSPRATASSATIQCTIDIVKTGTTEVLASVSLKTSQRGFASPNEFDRIYFAFSEMGTEVTELLLSVLK